VDLVRGDLLPLPASSDDDANIGSASNDGSRDLGADRRVVNRFDRVGPKVDDDVIGGRGHVRDERRFQSEAGVIGSEDDSHARRLGVVDFVGVERSGVSISTF
jgi:hypothetical protein